MTKAVLKGVRLYAGAVALAGQTNRIELPVEREAKDVTTFGSYDPVTDSIWKELIGGLGSGKVTASGFWETGVGSLDEDAFANLGATGPWSVIPVSTANIGDPAFVLNATRTQYTLLGAPGDVAPYSANTEASGPVARGVILNPPGTARTATGSATPVQIGALSATQRLVAAVHVLSIAGTATPTVTVKIQSDDTVGFSSPTDRITFAAATAVGSQYSSAAGAVTDTYWRANYTISGTSPSFLVLVTAGIVG